MFNLKLIKFCVAHDFTGIRQRGNRFAGFLNLSTCVMVFDLKPSLVKCGEASVNVLKETKAYVTV